MPDALAPGCQALQRARTHVIGHHMIEENLPVTFVRQLRVGMQHPEDRHAEVPQTLRQCIDGRHDAARGRHLGG